MTSPSIVPAEAILTQLHTSQCTSDKTPFQSSRPEQARSEWAECFGKRTASWFWNCSFSRRFGWPKRSRRTWNGVCAAPCSLEWLSRASGCVFAKQTEGLNRTFTVLCVLWDSPRSSAAFLSPRLDFLCKVWDLTTQMVLWLQGVLKVINRQSYTFFHGYIISISGVNFSMFRCILAFI